MRNQIEDLQLRGKRERAGSKASAVLDRAAKRAASGDGDMRKRIAQEGEEQSEEGRAAATATPVAPEAAKEVSRLEIGEMVPSNQVRYFSLVFFFFFSKKKVFRRLVLRLPFGIKWRSGLRCFNSA